MFKLVANWKQPEFCEDGLDTLHRQLLLSLRLPGAKFTRILAVQGVLAGTTHLAGPVPLIVVFSHTILGVLWCSNNVVGSEVPDPRLQGLCIVGSIRK